MDERPEVIRSQMDQTRADLTDKLESLESRVSEGMQATGTAVSETYTSISGAAQAVSDALNFPLHVRRHPWLAVGGSFAVGYLAAQWSGSIPRRTTTERETTIDLQRTRASPAQMNAPGVFMSLLRDIAARALPQVLDSLFARPAPTPLVAEMDESTLPLSMRPRHPLEQPHRQRSFRTDALAEEMER